METDKSSERTNTPESGQDQAGKHTPRPWEFTEGRNKDGEREGVIHNEVTICHLSDDPHGCIANGHLIAAAPDLLEALKYARRFLNDKDHDVAFVDAAIAKTKGVQP